MAFINLPFSTHTVRKIIPDNKTFTIRFKSEGYDMSGSGRWHCFEWVSWARNLSICKAETRPWFGLPSESEWAQSRQQALHDQIAGFWRESENRCGAKLVKNIFVSIARTCTFLKTLNCLSWHGLDTLWTQWMLPYHCSWFRFRFRMTGTGPCLVSERRRTAPDAHLKYVVLM